MTSAVRGRRPDPGPVGRPGSASKGCDALVAWLLRVNRIYGPQERLAVAARFTHAFTAGPSRLAASESQVSRWEHATIGIPHRVVRRYEQVLELADGQLTAVADTLYRERLGRLGPPTLHRQDDPQARQTLGRLCEQALGGDVMTGQEWDELTIRLWSIPVLLHPRRLWNQLAERVLGELLIAEGVSWLRRCEAVNRLLGHVDGAAPVIEACAAIFTDQRSQVVIEPTVLLELTPDPSAAGHLLRQLENPTSPQVLRAAWWAVAEKAGRGHFTESQAQTLARIAMSTLEDQAAPAVCRTGAAETLRQLAPRLGAHLRGLLVRVVGRDAATGHVLQSGTTLSMQACQAIAQRLARETLMNMPREVLRHDPTLEQLIVEMLFHSQGTRRVVAGQTIAATPYRRPLAAAIAKELARHAANVALAPALVQSLTHLGGQAESALVQRLALTGGLPAPVSETAAWVVGHLPAQPDFWAQVAMRLTQAPSPNTKGLIYSLGTAGRHTELTALANSVAVTPDLRTAASWWLTIPGHIARSAKS